MLVAYIHHWHSEMAGLSGRPGTALDHAFAAQGWARRGASNLMRARADIIEAWAHALDGNATESRRRLESARTWAAKPTSSEPSYLYWVRESQGMVGTTCFVYDALGRPGDVIQVTTSRLAGLDPGFSRERSFGLIHQGMALTQSKEIPAATAKLSEAVTLMRTHSSARLTHLIRQARKRLEPWSGYSYVRHLDDRLRTVTVV